MFKSKCVVFKAPKQVVMDEIEINKPGPREVIIKSLYTLVSIGTELTILKGEFPPNSEWARHGIYPFYPGYNNVGEVVAIGEGVNNLKIGEKVFCWGPHSQFFLKGLDERSNVGDLFKGVYKIPENVSLQEVTYATFGQISLNGVRLGEIAFGESAVIIGVGPIGQLTVQLARLSGCFPVIAIDLSEQRLKISRKSGADFTVCPKDENVREEIMHLTRGRMADIVFEVSGNPKVIPWALTLLKRRGKLIILGSPRDKATVDFQGLVQTLGLRIIGAHDGLHTPYETPYNQWTVERDYELFLDLISSGRMNVKDLITHVFSWREIPKAYQLLLEDRTKFMGVLFDWTVQ